MFESRISARRPPLPHLRPLQHFLIGAACNVGADRLQQRARELHLAAQNPSAASARPIAPLVADVEAALRECIPQIVAHLRTSPPSTPACHIPDPDIDAVTGAVADAVADAVTAAFPELRLRLDALRRHNRRNRPRAVRAEAEAAAATAGAAGLHRLAAAAGRAVAAAGQGRFLSAEAVDEMEMLLDAAEALWRSCRCRV